MPWVHEGSNDSEPEDMPERVFLIVYVKPRRTRDL